MLGLGECGGWLCWGETKVGEHEISIVITCNKHLKWAKIDLVKLLRGKDANINLNHGGGNALNFALEY